MMPKQRKVLKQAFWIQWVLANTTAWIIGVALVWVLGEVSLDGIIIRMIGWGVCGALVGMVFGINHWFIFKPLIPKILDPRAGWWVLATIIGWTISFIIVIGMNVGDKLGFPISGAIIGGIVGIMQWFVLRWSVDKAIFWGIFNSIAWMIGLWMIECFDQAVGLAIAGTVSSCITGAVFIWLLNHTRFQEGEQAPGNRATIIEK